MENHLEVWCESSSDCSDLLISISLDGNSHKIPIHSKVRLPLVNIEQLIELSLSKDDTLQDSQSIYIGESKGLVTGTVESRGRHLKYSVELIRPCMGCCFISEIKKEISSIDTTNVLSLIHENLENSQFQSDKNQFLEQLEKVSYFKREEFEQQIQQIQDFIQNLKTKEQRYKQSTDFSVLVFDNCHVEATEKPTSLTLERPHCPENLTNAFADQITELQSVIEQLHSDKQTLSEELLSLKTKQTTSAPENSSEVGKLHSEIASLKFHIESLELEKENQGETIRILKEESEFNLSQREKFAEHAKELQGSIFELESSQAENKKNSRLILQYEKELAESKASITKLKAELTIKQTEDQQSLDNLESSNKVLQDKIVLQEKALETHENQTNTLKNKVNDLTGSLETLQREKENLVLENAKTFLNPGLVENLHNEISVLTSQVRIEDTKNQALTGQVLSLSEILNLNSKSNYVAGAKYRHQSEKLKEQETEIARLRRIVMKYKQIRPNYVPVKDDPVDVALADYINGLDEPLDMQFIREGPGVYYYGNKRVFIKLDSGKIILRIGGGYMRIEEFVSICTSDGLQKKKTKEETTPIGSPQNESIRYRREESKLPLPKRPSTPSMLNLNVPLSRQRRSSHSNKGN